MIKLRAFVAKSADACFLLVYNGGGVEFLIFAQMRMNKIKFFIKQSAFSFRV